MAIKFSQAVRNARLDAIETAILAAGAVATLRLYAGAVPAAVTDAPGTLLCQISLPSSDFMSAASGGIKDKTGTWSGTGAAGAGAGTTATYWRLYDAAGTPVCHAQGSVSATAGGGDMELDNVSIANGQTVTVTQFRFTDGNA